MTQPTSDAEDFADYTDEHQRQAAPDPETVQQADTPDVADPPATEPPD